MSDSDCLHCVIGHLIRDHISGHERHEVIGALLELVCDTIHTAPVESRVGLCGAVMVGLSKDLRGVLAGTYKQDGRVAARH